MELRCSTWGESFTDPEVQSAARVAVVVNAHETICSSAGRAVIQDLLFCV